MIYILETNHTIGAIGSKIVFSSNYQIYSTGILLSMTNIPIIYPNKNIPFMYHRWKGFHMNYLPSNQSSEVIGISKYGMLISKSIFLRIQKFSDKYSHK